MNSRKFPSPTKPLRGATSRPLAPTSSPPSAPPAKPILKGPSTTALSKSQRNPAIPPPGLTKKTLRMDISVTLPPVSDLESSKKSIGLVFCAALWEFFVSKSWVVYGSLSEFTCAFMFFHFFDHAVTDGADPTKITNLHMRGMCLDDVQLLQKPDYGFVDIALFPRLQNITYPLKIKGKVTIKECSDTHFATKLIDGAIGISRMKEKYPWSQEDHNRDLFKRVMDTIRNPSSSNSLNANTYFPSRVTPEADTPSRFLRFKARIGDITRRSPEAPKHDLTIPAIDRISK